MNSTVPVLHAVPSSRTARPNEWPQRHGAPTHRKLQRAHAPASFWVQWLLLLCAIPACFELVVLVLGSQDTALSSTVDSRVLMILALGLVLLTYPRFGVFRRLRNLRAMVLVVSTAWFFVVAELIALCWFLNVSFAAMMQPVLLGWVAAVIGAQALLVVGASVAFHWIGQTTAVQTPVLLVGSGQLAANLLRALTNNPFLSDEVVGLVRDRAWMSQAPTSDWFRGLNTPELGDVEALPQLIADYGIERVYLALPFEQTRDIRRIQVALRKQNVDVIWAPDVTSVELLNPTMKEIAGMPLLALSESPLSNVGSAYLKSLFDVVVASVALVLASPVMLVAGLAVKLTSRGPVFYKQKRNGWDGSLFEIWKFRSMYVHSEEDGQVTQAKADDDRVTPVGRVLRRTSIDELPQLFNVLNGTMSLVGPRPHAVAHNLEYADKIHAYMSRHRIKPGITGLAQIQGLRGETETIDKMRKRVERDIQYINDWSILHDLWIVIRTPLALFRSRGAY